MSNSITFLKLSHFRNHINLSSNFNKKHVIIVGDNGIGKTNILESISLLAPGRGLRNSKFEEMINNRSSNPSWKISVNLNNISDFHEIEINLHKDNNSKFHKKITFDGSNKSPELLNDVPIVWLTPQMDQLVSGPSADRRKFFDRIVFNFYPEHAKLITKYEKLIKERSHILKNNRYEKIWLEAIEEKIVEYGIKAAKLRVKICSFLQETILSYRDQFPHIILKLNNDIEEMLQDHSLEEVEIYFKKKLYENRENDFIMGRTNTGIHRTDLILYHKEKNLIASNCSTGEQKAILVNLILAQAHGLISRNNANPILLLDEIVAHLDEERRRELFKRINSLGIQSWMTGTEPDLFIYMEDQAEIYNLNENGIKQIEFIS